MKLPKKKAKVVLSALGQWVEEGVLSADQGRNLSARVEILRFDWKRLAKYSFWLSISCIVISVITIFTDTVLLSFLEKIFEAPPAVKSASVAIVAACLFSFGLKRKGRHPDRVFSNEAVFFVGVLTAAGAIAFLGQALDTGSGHFSLLLLLASLLYGGLGLWFPSKLVWVFALLSLGSWLGAESGYASGWGAYYLGMNYPLRFVLFGAVLTGASVTFGNWKVRAEFQKPTRAMGLLYLFIALWILSIFGNYGDMNEWREVRQIEMFHWSLIFALVAGGAIIHGVKQDDGMTRGFGIVFIFINLYTRFFEYFWNGVHKAIFFALLAASLWAIGSRAEKIWNLEQLSRRLKSKARDTLPSE